MDANRDTEEWKMEAKVRDEILDRVMRVLVEEKGGQDGSQQKGGKNNAVQNKGRGS